MHNACVRAPNTTLTTHTTHISTHTGIPSSRHIYLGLYSEERDAARAYDTALVS